MACTCANNLFSPFISYDPPPSSFLLLLASSATFHSFPPSSLRPSSHCFCLFPSLSSSLSASYTPSSRSLPLSPVSIYVAFRIIAFFVERVWLNSLEIIHLPNCHSSTWIVDASPRKPSPPSTPLPPPPPVSTPIPIRDNDDEFRLSIPPCNRTSSRQKTFSFKSESCCAILVLPVRLEQPSTGPSLKLARIFE